MLRGVTHKTDAWSIIKGFARNQNGRQAYISLTAHFKGRGHISRIKTDARNVLERIFWKGSTRNFTFDVFVSRLQGVYHDLAEYGDNRTDESKVDTLITKVAGDSSLSSACTFIRNDAQLSGDFTATIQYLSTRYWQRTVWSTPITPGIFQVRCRGEISYEIVITMEGILKLLAMQSQIQATDTRKKEISF